MSHGDIAAIQRLERAFVEQQRLMLSHINPLGQLTHSLNQITDTLDIGRHMAEQQRMMLDISSPMKYYLDSVRQMTETLSFRDVLAHHQESILRYINPIKDVMASVLAVAESQSISRTLERQQRAILDQINPAKYVMDSFRHLNESLSIGSILADQQRSIIDFANPAKHMRDSISLMTHSLTASKLFGIQDTFLLERVNPSVLIADELAQIRDSIKTSVFDGWDIVSRLAIRRQSTELYRRSFFELGGLQVGLVTEVDSLAETIFGDRDFEEIVHLSPEEEKLLTDLASQTVGNTSGLERLCILAREAARRIRQGAANAYQYRSIFLHLTGAIASFAALYVSCLSMPQYKEWQNRREGVEALQMARVLSRDNNLKLPPNCVVAKDCIISTVVGDSVQSTSITAGTNARFLQSKRSNCEIEWLVDGTIKRGWIKKNDLIFPK